MTCLAARILHRVHNRCDVFINNDFLDLAGRETINKELARLCKEGHLRRLARGLYDVPYVNPLLGQVAPPDLGVALSAIERRDNITIVRNGMACANRLQLTTAVSVNNDYLTDGASRTLKIGSHIIRLKHAGPALMMFGKRPAGDVVRALHWLGKELANSGSVIATLRRVLPDWAKEDLEEARPLVTDWTEQVLNQIIE